MTSAPPRRPSPAHSSSRPTSSIATATRWRERRRACHLFRVASGLDSAVIGEDEILGQVRRAFAEAQERESAGLVLTRLFQEALAAGKRVRSETEIGRCPVSVSGAAASILLERWGWESLEDASVLLVGAGEMARGVARCLQGMQARDLTVANRTYARARELARETGPMPSAGRSRQSAWPNSTPSSAAQVRPASSSPGRRSRRRPAGCPPAGRFTSSTWPCPATSNPRSPPSRAFHLSNIDDARTIVDDSLNKRSQHVAPAERIIEEQLEGFLEWMASRSASDSIRLLKEQCRPHPPERA